MIEPRGSGRRGWVVGTGPGVDAGVLGTGVPALPGAGVLSCANTARAASRAAAVCAGPGFRCSGVVELAPDRAWNRDEFGVICMTIKFYANPTKNPLIADSTNCRTWNKCLWDGVNAVPLICSPTGPPGRDGREKTVGGG